MDYFYNFEKVAYLRAKKPDGCILCLIRERSEEVENLTIFENDLTNVSLNLYPYNPGHLIVFPLRHVEDLRDMTDEEQRNLNEIVNASLDILQKVYKPTGINYGCNMGLDAGASIAHLHFHIIPRYPRETGIADLIAGKRILVENPLDSLEKLRDAFNG